MKHFKFKTTVRVAGFRTMPIQGVAYIKKKRVTISHATELINERVALMVKHSFKKSGETESVINSLQFKTTVEVLPVDFMIDLDVPMLKPEVSSKVTPSV